MCGQYDEYNRFHVDYYFPFFRGTGITTQEQVTVERHLDREEGRVLLPAMKDKEAVKVEKEVMKNRSNLIAAARDGDEEAMESLTMEDMDTYSMISQRIATEDLFSIVESYFMPYGIQCDQYSILGEILDVHTFKNIQMTVECNNMQFDVCINREDLLGEPTIGRRLRANIWLQGQVHF